MNIVKAVDIRELQRRALRWPKAEASQQLQEKHMTQIGRVVVGLTVNK